MATTITTREISLHAITHDAVDGLFVVDRNRKITVFTEGCERICGANAASAIGSDCPRSDVMDGSPEQSRRLSGLLCPAHKILDGEIQSFRRRMNVDPSDGQRVCVETTYSPIRDERGHVSGVVGVVRDVTGVVERENDVGGVPATCAASGDDAVSDTVVERNESDGAKSGPLDQVLTSIERREILGALQRARGQRTLAARLLGISRSRLYRRMEAIGVDLTTVSRSTSH